MAVVIPKLCLGSLKLVCLAHTMPSPALQKWIDLLDAVKQNRDCLIFGSYPETHDRSFAWLYKVVYLLFLTAPPKTWAAGNIALHLVQIKD